MGRVARKTLDSPNYYTIGWISALPIERAAATCLLDERHDEPRGFRQHQRDDNSYSWGRMGEHNVVLASLPAGIYGTSAAAATASQLISSLPHIRIGLLVGIGGGIARPDAGVDIRLGDVVVSQPDGMNGGVVQYDLVKALSGGRRERRDFLSMPPSVLLGALAELQAEHKNKESKMSEYLSNMVRENPRLVREPPGYVHQGSENDQLFKASYDHAGRRDCSKCNSSQAVKRAPRNSKKPRIHYGTIASGNMLVKSAAERDAILQHVGEGCLCIEMEAAGLMNHFPCLVIRGICDYADSHKNDRWQRYASATAAAFAKELLNYVPASGLRDTQRAADRFPFS
jgi:nucleoside phosphorylase